MKNRLKNRLLKTMCLALILVMSAGLVGCYANGSDLMDGIKPGRVDTIEGLTVEGGALSTADFAVRLFRESSANAENVLVSPLSVMLALAMTQNGADGETLAQMESVLGLEKDELNKYLYSLVKMLPENDKCSLKLANSIWFSDI